MSQFGACCASTEQRRRCPLSPRCWQGGEAAGTFPAVSSWEEPGYSHFGGCRVEFFIFHRWEDEAETFPLMSRWSRGLSVSFSVPGALFCSGTELMANVWPRHFGFVFFPPLLSGWLHLRGSISVHSLSPLPSVQAQSFSSAEASNPSSASHFPAPLPLFAALK